MMPILLDNPPPSCSLFLSPAAVDFSATVVVLVDCNVFDLLFVPSKEIES